MSNQSNLLPGAFVGTAAAYARYRPPYPKALLNQLVAHAGIPDRGRLLDLACGPGRVTLALAASFESVWAVDLEPEMIEVGKQEAARRGINNVVWFVGRAEDLQVPPGAFDLITIGEAFHRLDQGLIVEKALAGLKPGGCVATLGSEGILDGREPWQRVAAEVARRWMARAFPDGWGVGRAGAEVGPGSEERVLRQMGLVEVESRSFLEPCDWTFEELIGYLQSTSVCSRKALGDDFEAFETELKAVLLGLNGTGSFHEVLGFGYTLGRKPR